MVQGGSRAEQSAAPDCLQRPLLRRARFRQQVSASLGAPNRGSTELLLRKLHMFTEERTEL
jgi:hypothetical protein